MPLPEAADVRVQGIKEPEMQALQLRAEIRIGQLVRRRLRQINALIPTSNCTTSEAHESQVLQRNSWTGGTKERSGAVVSKFIPLVLGFLLLAFDAGVRALDSLADAVGGGGVLVALGGSRN